MTNDLTSDSLFSGKLICTQRRDGYRFSIDSVLLAHFVNIKKNQKVLDLGAGCGIISLILAYRWPQISISCLEIQKNLANLIKQNIIDNKFDDQITVVEGDLCKIKHLIDAGIYDWVICNPPFYRHSSGRCNPNSELAIARHQIELGLLDILHATSYALKNRGRAAFIYPAEQSDSLIQALSQYNLSAKRLQTVYSYPGGKGKLILLEVNKNGGQGVDVLPPLYIYKEKNSDYSEEVAAMYQ